MSWAMDNALRAHWQCSWAIKSGECVASLVQQLVLYHYRTYLINKSNPTNQQQKTMQRLVNIFLAGISSQVMGKLLT